MAALKLSQLLASSHSDLAAVINTIAAACIELSEHIAEAPVRGQLGRAELVNVQGEEQKKLDVVADELLVAALSELPQLAWLASEEREQAQALNPQGEWAVAFDPLDGSSNIDSGISIGTVFSIQHCQLGATWQQALLQRGHHQQAAGYVLYGPYTVMVLALGGSTYLLGLDRQQRQFVLLQQPLQLAPTTAMFAINAANRQHWLAPTEAYVGDCLAGKKGPRAKDFNMRWVASMVADIHRTLIQGGVFLYPTDHKTQHQGGRLRLLYEANPMALVVEWAGGLAYADQRRILDIQPEHLHQRIGVIAGSREEVITAVSYYR